MADIEHSPINDEKVSEIKDTGLSKSQQKKLKKREKWLEIKHDKRKATKQKRKQRLAEKRKNGEDIGPSRKSLKLNLMRDSKCHIKVVLDLSLDDYMSEKDITSLTSQIQHCYSANRRAANPIQLYACVSKGRTQQRLENIGDYKGWDIHFNEEKYLEVFPKESLVYLSSDSPNVLTSLSEDKVYVIGGIVDHNSHKGLCHRLAEENGIAHAKLPISEYLHMKGRKVLTVNNVFSILLRFTESGDWKKAFVSELPTRKGFAPVFDKETKDSTEDNTESVVDKCIIENNIDNANEKENKNNVDLKDKEDTVNDLDNGGTLNNEDNEDKGTQDGAVIKSESPCEINIKDDEKGKKSNLFENPNKNL